MTVIILSALIISAAFILAWYNHKLSSCSCLKSFRKELRDISGICEGIDLLSDCTEAFDNRSALSVLCENRSRICDIVYSVTAQIRGSGMIITPKEWRGMFILCKDLLDKQNGRLDLEELTAKLRRRAARDASFSSYTLYALQPALSLAALCLMKEQISRLIAKQRLIKRLKYLCSLGRDSAVTDELFREPEQIYNLFLLDPDAGKRYSGCIDKAVMACGIPLKTLLHNYGNSNTCLNLSVNNLLHTLITMRTDIDEISAAVSEREKLLAAQDDYANSDKHTRMLYKRELYRFCRAGGITEPEAISGLSSLCAQHTGLKAQMGYYLLSEGQKQYMRLLGCRVRAEKSKRAVNSTLYGIIFGLFCIEFSVIVLPFMHSASSAMAAAAFFLLLPLIITAAKIPADALLLGLTENTVLPKLKDGFAVRKENKTVLAVPCLLSSMEKCARLIAKLERCMLSNPGYCYALVGDFPPCAVRDEKNERLICGFLESGIKRLNEKYGNMFSCFIRQNVKCGGGFAPFERKRGALAELCRFVTGGENRFMLSCAGENAADCRFVFTIDEDTVLSPGAVTALICTAAHPLNQTVGGRPRMLQPDVITGLLCSGGTRFARAYLSGRLLSVYPAVSGDVFARLADYSPFGGKGIFDARAYLEAFDRIPQGRILSHDQPEGDLLKCISCSGAEAAESVPQNPQDYLMREHRWIRGDWQNLTFLAGRKGFSSVFSLCVLLNCITSLKEAGTLAALILLCAFSPDAFPAGILAALIMFAVPLAVCLLQRISGFLGMTEEVCDAADAAAELSRKFISACISLILLPCKAFIAFDAAVKALFRSAVKSKKLLQWSDGAQNSLSMAQYFSFMWASPFFGLLTLLLSAANGINLPISCIICILYGFAPVIYHALSKPAEEKKYSMSASEKQALYYLSARTLCYFVDGMSENNRFIPPDNYQQEPYKGFCSRTSVTNIGFGILSVVCGCKMGLLSVSFVLSLLQKTMDTVESLPRLNDCHYNWYDVHSGKQLGGFVSAVDCGNFCACLLASAELLRLMQDKADIDDETGGKLAVLIGAALNDEKTLEKQCRELSELNAQGVREWLKDCVYGAGESCKAIENTAVSKILRHWTEPQPDDRRQSVISLAERMEAVARGENLGFLYNRDKKIFYTGFDGIKGEYTRSCYDLFASENLLCSYIAIAMGHVPPQHWYALSRKTVRLGSGSVLMSWSGTMFETLMPLLFLESGSNTLLDTTAREVVNRNIITGEMLKTPFGISESCSSDINRSGDYCYTAFGLPCLALDSKQARPVFAPYASLLGIELYTPEVYKNVARFTAAGMADRYGLFESLDCRYLPPRAAKCYMSHHQGMILASLCNMLQDGAVRRAFMNRAEMSACRLLLYQDMPPGIPYKRWPDSSKFRKSGPFTCNTAAARLCGGAVSFDMYRDGFGMVFDGITVIPAGKKRSDRAGRIYISDGMQCLPVYWDSITAQVQQISCRCESISGICVSCTVLPMLDGKSILLHIQMDKKPASDSTMLYFEADLCLAPMEQYQAHPQYSNLFVRSSASETGASAGLSRYNSGLSCAAGIRCSDESAVYYTSRRDFCGRDNLYTAEPEPGEQYEVSTEPMLGFTAEPLFRDGHWECTVIITAGYSVGEVNNTLRSGIDKSAEEYKALAQQISCEYIDRLRLSDYEQNMLLKLSEAVLCGTAKSKNAANVVKTEDMLFRLGMSGRKKLLLIRLQSADEMLRLQTALRCISLLAQSEDIDVIIYPAEELVKKTEYADAVNDCAARFTSESCKIAIITGDAEACGALADAVLPLYEPPQVNEPKPLFLPKTGGFTRSDLSYISPGFCRDGYMICGTTPKPWCNIFSNGRIGAVVADNGAGNTFGANARLEHYTAESSDWVRNVPSEAVYIRDDATGDVWTVTSSPINRGDDHAVLHGFGYSRFYYDGFRTECTQTVFADAVLPLKHYLVNLTNTSGERRSITLGFYADAFIGESYMFDKKYCTYRACGEYACCSRGDKKLYLSGADRYGVCSGAFLGSGGNLCAPKLSLEEEGPADCLCGIKHITLEPHGKAEVCFTMGTQVQDGSSKQEALAKAAAVYAMFTDRIIFNTGSADRDSFLTAWLPYQTFSSRFMARCGYYQTGGAVGFRDQLQDCLCLMYFDKKLVRKHITECAKHQYIEGDVQHWWHSETLGVRTRITDDRLWLPYVACRYAEFCGDYGIFDDTAHYLQGNPVQSEAYYGDAVISTEQGSIYEHCKRALDISMTAGEHGIPLIGGGDWNDAMDEAGNDDQGESVWLGWFFLAAADGFEAVARRRGDASFADKLVKYSRGLLEALETSAWEEDRYLRAFTAEGEVLGSKTSHACKIDAISQAWAVISGFADRDRAIKAIRTAYRLLRDKQHGIVRLLTPPFSVRTERAGYINDYPVGIRENGGQYTHGAIWLAKAFALCGFGDEAWEILQTVSPLSRTDRELQQYGNEPYVLSADIYADGRGGWSWYTGAAGWYYTTVLEDIFGIRISGDGMRIEPCFPSVLSCASLTLDFDGTVYTVKYHNPLARSGGSSRITLDGHSCDGVIPIKNDKMQHKISVIV